MLIINGYIVNGYYVNFFYSKVVNYLELSKVYDYVVGRGAVVGKMWEVQ